MGKKTIQKLITIVIINLFIVLFLFHAPLATASTAETKVSIAPNQTVEINITSMNGSLYLSSFANYGTGQHSHTHFKFTSNSGSFLTIEYTYDPSTIPNSHLTKFVYHSSSTHLSGTVLDWAASGISSRDFSVIRHRSNGAILIIGTVTYAGTVFDFASNTITDNENNFSFNHLSIWSSENSYGSYDVSIRDERDGWGSNPIPTATPTPTPTPPIPPPHEIPWFWILIIAIVIYLLYSMGRKK